MTKKNLRAFSLFEMSMVIIIISLTIAGITLSTRLIGQSSLARAKILTKNSPVKDIENLLFWFETSLEESFILNEIGDANSISVWKNLALNQTFSADATQTSGASQPKFYEKIINNSIPVLRFDGNSDWLLLNNLVIKKLLNSPYTIFVVEMRTSSKSGNYFIGGSDSGSGENLVLGYKDSNTIAQDHLNGSFDYDIDNYSEPLLRIHSFNYSLTDGKIFYLDGSLNPNKTEVGASNPVNLFNGASIGQSYYTNYYQGDIAEIIIFNRNLGSQERNAIFEYLAKKYDFNRLIPNPIFN